jgi:hypothetical protein
MALAGAVCSRAIIEVRAKKNTVRLRKVFMAVFSGNRFRDDYRYSPAGFRFSVLAWPLDLGLLFSNRLLNTVEKYLVCE